MLLHGVITLPDAMSYDNKNIQVGYIMLHYLNGASIQVAIVVNYNYPPQEGGNNRMAIIYV